jgi:xanthine/uracil/vitamin C permease (AzgA family)
MFPNMTYVIWLTLGPLLLIIGLLWVRKIPGNLLRTIARSFILAFILGFSGIGSDSAVIIVPAWAQLTPATDFSGASSILVWWIVLFIFHSLFNFVAIKMKKI